LGSFSGVTAAHTLDGLCSIKCAGHLKRPLL
jgi:hypothetical protein